ncbi:FhaA domain-containing protein [Herbiconiux sp. P17]|uniref:FhaA domain-containing protein n=1 Tax=Herbiconiux wuyangfengii TaxID=3342794 RepID=UPI0035B986CE
MGILDNFEKGLERAVNGAFAKTFRSGLQPVEISSALKRELDTKAAVVSRDRILVPNSFRVLLAPTDYQRMTGIGPTLVDDLNQIVQQHAAQQGFQFAGGVTIDLVNDPKLTTGVIQIDSANVQGNVTWTPVLDIAGRRHPITKSRTIIGRGSDADITVDDTGTSRKHVEILWDGSHAQARDLGSTNGSQLNGQAFQRANLEPDSVIQIGRTNIVFRIVPQSSSGSRGATPAAAAGATRQQIPNHNQSHNQAHDPNRPPLDPGGFWR